MTGLFFTLVFFVLLAFGLRYIRKREVERFMEVDMVDFQTFDQQQRSKPDPLKAKVEAFAAMNPNVVSLKSAEEVDEPNPVSAFSHPDPALFLLKGSPFDELTSHLFEILKQILPESFVPLRDVSLSDFIRVESNADATYRLNTTKIAYLICSLPSLRPVCGLILKGGEQSQDFVRAAFTDVGLPLLQFPATLSLSEAEVRDQLDPVLLTQEKHHCPKCKQTMTIRRAVKGKHAGNIFWVCSGFPVCRGVIRA
ncbi:MAG: hypothetical protein ACI8Z1_003366 [Candidatus Azotimanducaceae bacterium]|jgi:hypothetical protein